MNGEMRKARPKAAAKAVKLKIRERTKLALRCCGEDSALRAVSGCVLRTVKSEAQRGKPMINLQYCEGTQESEIRIAISVLEQRPPR